MQLKLMRQAATRPLAEHSRSFEDRNNSRFHCLFMSQIQQGPVRKKKNNPEDSFCLGTLYYPGDCESSLFLRPAKTSEARRMPLRSHRQN
ncbi:MAG: hypothetical protein ACI97A_001980 [Planctomycetota bacterium]|jgi:hypothetical protein